MSAVEFGPVTKICRREISECTKYAQCLQVCKSRVAGRNFKKIKCSEIASEAPLIPKQCTWPTWHGIRCLAVFKPADIILPVIFMKGSSF